MFRRAAVCAVALALLAGGASKVGSQSPLTVDQLVARASEYVLDFVVIFSNVVAEESYLQNWRGVRRLLVSDFLLVQPKDSPAYFALRDVLTSDGSRVRDREDRVMKLLTSPAGSTRTQLEEISRESGRFTFGGVFNSPVTALALLQPEYVSRLRFTVAGPDRSLGPDVWQVSFDERERPTILRGARDQDVQASGQFWIEGETGRVVKSALTLPNDSVVTSFKFDERFNIDVPVEMVDRYRYMNYTVNGTATYGRFRRFGVTTEEKIQ